MLSKVEKVYSLSVTFVYINVSFQDFKVLILNEAVLALARLYRRDVLAQPEDEGRNKVNRHTAYRQFVLWHHWRL
jgi:hypothetical protein